jgi:hypothetical protein
MTETREAAVISEALSVIDKALADMMHRELVSTGEVADLLLDVRTLLPAQPVAVLIGSGEVRSAPLSSPARSRSSPAQQAESDGPSPAAATLVEHRSSSPISTETVRPRSPMS